MIIKLRNGKYYDARAYGIETWGTCSQRNMSYSGDTWYEIYDVCVDFENNQWEREEDILDVIEEFEDVPEGVKLENEKDHDIFKNYCEEINAIVDKW